MKKLFEEKEIGKGWGMTGLDRDVYHFASEDREEVQEYQAVGEEIIPVRIVPERIWKKILKELNYETKKG